MLINSGVTQISDHVLIGMMIIAVFSDGDANMVVVSLNFL